MADIEAPETRIAELEIKLAFQDHVIRELDALVRAFGARLDDAEHQLAQLKEAMKSPEVPLGPANDRPPHY